MKKHLLTGFIILLPIALTLMIAFFLFDFFTEPFVSVVGPLVEFLQKKTDIFLPHGVVLFLSRILSLVFLFIFILFLGMITQFFLVKVLMNWGNLILLKIPFIKTVYKVARDIFAALFSTDGKKAFKKPVMLPFPSKPNYCLGFEAGEVAEEIRKKVPYPVTSVFVPTAPHPISGFLFLLPQEDVKDVEMSNEEVVKFLVSCGMILPESDRQKEEHD